jgi:hypothetical protein
MKRRVVRSKVDRPRQVFEELVFFLMHRSIWFAQLSRPRANDTRRGWWGGSPHVQPYDASVERWSALVRAWRSRLSCDRLLPASFDLLVFVNAPRAACPVGQVPRYSYN